MISNLKNLVYNLDKFNNSYFNTVKLKQNDIRTLEIHVYENGEELDLTGYTAVVKWVNANNTVAPLTTSNIEIKNNTIFVKMIADCTRSSGVAKWELVLSKNDSIDYSFTQEIKILSSVEQGQEESKNVSTLLEDVTKAQEEATKFVNTYGNLYGIKDKVDKLNNTKANRTELDTAIARIDNFTHLAEGSTTGDAELTDARIGANGITYNNVGGSIREQNNDINDLIEYISGGRALVNLINKNNITDNKLINGDGSIDDRAGVSYTNYYLFLYAGQKITINFDAHATIVVYNLDKTFNKRVITDATPFTYTAENNCYIRFNIYTAKVSEAIAIIGENIPDVFIYKNILIPKKIQKIENRSLEGSFLFCGDSICVGFGAVEKGGYSKLIAKNNPNMSYKNIAVSGATFGRRPDGNPGTSILNEIENEISTGNTYDYVVLEGGINDSWNQSTWALGTFDKYSRDTVLDEYTICGAFESAIRKVKDAWVKAKIYYIIPHLMTPQKSKDVFDTLLEICDKYAVTPIDLRKLSGMDTYNDYIKKTYTLHDGVGDGIHPNDEGYNTFYVKPITEILLQNNKKVI